MTGPRARAVRGHLSVFGNRDFRLFFSGYAVSLVGAAMVPVALTFAILQEDRPASQVGFVLAAETIPLVLLLLAGGVVADRFSRRTMMVASDAVRCVGELLLAVLVICGSPPLWVFVALAAVIGAGQAFFNPALTGLMPLVVGPHELQQANALKGVASSTGQLVGPAAAGLIAAAGGAGWAIAIDALTYAVSALCLIGLHLPVVTPGARESFVTQLSAGWAEFRSRTWLWVIVVQFGLFHLAVYAPFMVLGVVIADGTTGGAASWGLVLAAQGGGAIVGGVAVLRMRPRRPLITATLGTLAFTAPVVLLASGAPAVAVAVGAAVSGMGMAVFGALWDTTLQQHIPAEALSRVSAYDWLGSVALIPLGYALTGPISGSVGVTRTLWLAAGWSVVGAAAVLAVPAIRRVDGAPGPEPSRRETDSPPSLHGLG